MATRGVQPTSTKSEPQLHSVRPATLIPTKLSPPVPGLGTVQRSRLSSALTDSTKRRLTLVSAPAGFGKTTLVAQWLGSLSLPVAWLSLDESDSDLYRFLCYLLAALRKAAPGAGKRLQSLLNTPGLPPPQYLAEALVADLNRRKGPMLLVLDDFHAVSSKPVHVLVRHLTEHLPQSLRLLVLTREDPPWSLGRWRVRGWVCEIRERDLRFSVEEARAFFADSKLADETVGMLLDKTEGWAAGLRMIQLSMTQAANPEERARGFSAHDRLIADYLMEEVVATQPGDILEFLALTAPLERFCAPLCDHLRADRSGTPDSCKLIDRIARRNLFLVHLDHEGRWFRYHHLFRKFVVEHRDELPASLDWQETCRRAGEWCASEGLVEEALRYLVKADDINGAASLLWKHLHAALDADPGRHTLNRWLGIFPPGSERSRPALLVAQGYPLITRFDLPGLKERLNEAERLLGDAIAGDSPPEMQADIDAQRAFVLFWQGDVEGAFERAHRVLRSATERQGLARTLGFLYSSFSLAASGREEEAFRILSEALAADTARGGRHTAELLGTRAFVHAILAQIDGAREDARMVLQLHRAKPVADYFLGHVQHILGMVAYERNELDEAAHRFQQVRQLRYRVPSRIYHDSLIGLSLVALAKADPVGAERHATAARAFAVEAGDERSIRRSDSHEARLALAAGRPPVAIPPVVPADSVSIFLEAPTSSYAELQLYGPSCNDEAGRLAYIDEALEGAERCHNVRQAILLSALRAMALTARGDLDAGLDFLDKTLRRAEPNRLVRVFVDRGERLEKMLRALAERNPDDEYARFLIDAFPHHRGEEGRNGQKSTGPAESSERPGCRLEDLSNREMDVLLLLGERLTNKEIASRLFVSSETVKKHTLSIYRKLGVHRRRQAIAAAVAQGLIPRY